MRRTFLIAALYGVLQAVSLAAVASAHAEADAKPKASDAAPAAQGLPWERSVPAPSTGSDSTAPEEPASTAPEEPAAERSAEPKPATVETAAPAGPPHPVVAIIRDKLADPATTKDAEADDAAALRAFYGSWSGAPLFITEMGFTAKGQAALFEVAKADEWGLDAKAFALPEADMLPADAKAQALAEITLDLAILKYARFARGARHQPVDISELLDQAASLRDPKIVMDEISKADAPDAYLQSLHPKHEQFARLRQALLAARAEDADDPKKAKTKETDIRRLIINMERWRWMPEDLGALYVWLNTPEFMLYVVKDGKTILTDKTLVGTIGDATPIFSAGLETIVFNPDWVAPESVLEDKLRPALRRKYYNILSANKLKVSYRGRSIDPRKVDWNRVNIHNFTFTQKSGPKNVLGKAKFLYPNKHVVYMHDTLPYRRKVFQEKVRAIGYGCVRMEKPREFATLMLAEDQAMPASEVKEMWNKGINKSVTLQTKPPVHTTYFTAVVDGKGKAATFTDLYGLDRKHAEALFGDTEGFPEPPPERKKRETIASGPSESADSAAGTFANSLGFLEN